jgi:hypothetical protein
VWAVVNNGGGTFSRNFFVATLKSDGSIDTGAYAGKLQLRPRPPH